MNVRVCCYSIIERARNVTPHSSQSKEMTDPTDIIELPAIPANAPEWVRALQAHATFVDRAKIYHITRNLLFDS